MLPDGSFDSPVPFSIEALPSPVLAPEEGEAPDGSAVGIDPVIAYHLSFAVPTLNPSVEASLTFELSLGALPENDRARVRDAPDGGKLALVVKDDGANDVFQMFAVCAEGQTPAADGCVTLTVLDAGRQPVTGGAEPAFVRFESVAGHFSTYAVAITAPGEADLAITKTGPTGRAPTGRNITYVLNVTNNGPDAADAVVVTDSLPASVTFVSATPGQGTCSAQGDVVCELGTMGSGISVSIDIVVKPNQAGTITNVASATALTIDPVGDNNTSSVETVTCRLTTRRTTNCG